MGAPRLFIGVRLAGLMAAQSPFKKKTSQELQALSQAHKDDFDCLLGAPGFSGSSRIAGRDS
jgi:hypothetical protein